MKENRKDCPMRHENGNCTVSGGFCTAVNDPICEALHNAFDCGYRSGIGSQRELSSYSKAVESNDPLTLDDLRRMDGEPVWLNIAGGVWGLVDTSDFVAWLDRGGFVALDRLSGKVYRQKLKKGKMSVFAKTTMGKIPDSCTECKLGRRYGCVGDVYCRIMDEYFTGNVKPPYKDRPDSCPLVEMEVDYA